MVILPRMPGTAQISDPPDRPQWMLHLLGLGLLAANKVRRAIRPYDRPRPWSARFIERSVDYVFEVIRNWDGGFKQAGIDDWVRGRHVLELGPGPDLGTGLVLLAKGAASYVAVDRYPLLGATPDSFYDALLDRLSGEAEAWRAVEAYQVYRAGSKTSNLRYLLLGDGPDALPGDTEPRNLWLSQAALEHVPNPADLLGTLTAWCGADAIGLHHVDAATHTPWIREADPLNILRYRESVYRALRFPASPNRWRATKYVGTFTDLGWDLIATQPVHRLSERALKRIRQRLAPSFRSMTDEELAVFSFRLVLRRRPSLSD